MEGTNSLTARKARKKHEPLRKKNLGKKTHKLQDTQDTKIRTARRQVNHKGTKAIEVQRSTEDA